MFSHIEEIKAHLLPSKLIGKSVSLKQRTAYEYIGLCPFHSEKTPSFTVSDDKKFFHCFGCGENGDVISFLAKIEKISYKDASLKLADDMGIEVKKPTRAELAQKSIYTIYSEIYEYATNYYQRLLFSKIGKKALVYLNERGITNESIKKFRIGYAPIDSNELIEELTSKFKLQNLIDCKIIIKSYEDDRNYSLFRDRIMFPIMDMQKRTIAFGGRSLGNAKPKYINSSENPLFIKGDQLYGLCFVDKKSSDEQKLVIIVEGYIDVIALFQAGFSNVVAPLGTAFRSSQLQLVWNNFCKNPVILFDNDIAGRLAVEKAVYNNIELLKSNDTLKIAIIKNCKDPDELVKLYGKQALNDVIINAKPVSKFIFECELFKKANDTPEQKADLKKRLSNIVNRIKDSELKSQYKSFFYECFAESFYKRKGKTIALKTDEVTQAINKKASNYKELIITLLSYPKLLANNMIWEGLINLEFKDNELNLLRNELLNKFETAVNMKATPDDKHDNIESIGASILSSLKLKGNNLSIKKIEDASSYAIRLLRLINLEKLEMQIQTLSQDVLSSASVDDFVRLASLKQIYDNLKLELGIF